MSKLDDILEINYLQWITPKMKQKQAIKALFIELIGENPKGDHEIAEGVRQYQVELRQKVSEL